MPTADNDILRVVAKMSIDGNDVQNVYHLRADVTSDPGDATVLSEIADYLDDAYAQVNGTFDGDLTYDSIAVWNVSTDTFIGETTWPVRTSGGSATDMLPIQTSPIVLFGTNVNRSQGRKFLPPMTEGNCEADGTPTAATHTVLGNYAAAILAGVTGTGWDGIPGNWNEAKARFVDWVYATIKDFFATQRRRYRASGS